MSTGSNSTIVDIRKRLKITKVTATRSVKTKSGDYFVGFSAAWDSVQDDGAQSGDLLVTEQEESSSGMTLREARIAHMLLAMQADLSAHEAALAGGGISEAYHRDMVRALSAKYMAQLNQLAAPPAKAEKV